uniref:NfeD family protein n=1 Tax=Stieleria sp. TaxID=2795976 RepID=UPI0035618B76
WDLATVLGAFVGFMIAMLILANYIGDIPGLGRLTLKPQMAMVGADAGPGEPADADAAALLPGWQRVSVGDVGTATSPLRPGGKMMVDDYSVDVVTEGDFVDNGTSVKVIAKQGTRIVVRPV